MASEIKVDTISENTAANGVTIDGVLLKDSKIGGTITIPGSTGTLALTSDISAGGLDGAQIFRLTTNTNSNTYLKAWEVPDDSPNQGTIGSYVSVNTSTGYFSFSATGYYLVLTTMQFFYNGSQTIFTFHRFSTDGFSTYDDLAGLGYGSGYSSGGKTTAGISLLDITNTTNDKFAVYGSCGDTSNYVQGNTNYNMSTVAFLRIGDT